MPEFRITIELFLEQLAKIRADLGEEAYLKARHEVILGIILKPNGEDFLSRAFPDIDLAPYKAEAEKIHKDAPKDPQSALIELLRQYMPGLKTQAQFDIFMMSFDALRLALEAYFAGDPAGAKRARAALDTVLDRAEQVNELAEQLKEIPPEKRAAFNSFLEPPKEYTEYEDHRRLMVELEGLASLKALNEWYGRSKPTMDRIVSGALRNELFDAIRDRKRELHAKEAN
jgi:hypothetical protein